MMEKEQLRKADFFSGIVIALFGAWILYHAFRMPMKDSWGGVQNVWFVSPALFPLFVGSVVVLLGLLLSRHAWKSVGRRAVAGSVRWLASRDCGRYLLGESVLRFFAIAVLFLSFVYLFIPRVDFFLSSVLFLVVFITQFHLDDAAILRKLFLFHGLGAAAFAAAFGAGLVSVLGRVLPFAGDLLVLAFLLGYGLYARFLVRDEPVLRRKLRTGLIVALVTPFAIGPVFKYFLLVPLPTEGLIVELMDRVRYLEF